MKRQDGFTLIEVLIAMVLMMLVITMVMNVTLFSLNQHRERSTRLASDQNLRQSLNLIEKRLRELDRESVIYHPSHRTFEAVMKVPESTNPVTVRVDLSGNIRYSRHTWIYYHRHTGTLRVNKNMEHNILSQGIKDIGVTEVEAGSLFQITLVCAETDLSRSLLIHFPPASEGGEES